MKYGRKGKGILIHSIAERNGMPMSCKTAPADTDERAVVLTLPDDINPKTGKVGRPRKRIKVLAGIKGMILRNSEKTSENGASDRNCPSVYGAERKNPVVL